MKYDVYEGTRADMENAAGKRIFSGQNETGLSKIVSKRWNFRCGTTISAQAKKNYVRKLLAGDTVLLGSYTHLWIEEAM